MKTNQEKWNAIKIWISENECNYPKVFKSLHWLTKIIYDFADKANAELIKENEQLKEKIQKLEFMIENGLGNEDMVNDVTYPHEL